MDSSLYQDINTFAVRTAWLHGIARGFAVYAVGLFALIVITAWWYARWQPDSARAVAVAIWAAAATLIAVVVNQPIAHAVARTRPYATIPHVEVLVPRSTDFSFPSDHAITAGAAAAGICIIALYGGRAVRNLAIASAVLAVLIAFARVYVGAHYPGDVLAALAIGAAVTTIGWLIVNRPLITLTTALSERAGLRPLVTAPKATHSRHLPG